MDLIHILIMKKVTNIKVDYINFPEIIFSNEFNLFQILQDSFPLQFAVFLWLNKHRKPLFPKLKVLTRKSVNKSNELALF